MTGRDRALPTIDVPLSDAVQELTGFESLAIESHFHAKLEDLGGVSLTIGAVWAYENRKPEKRNWASVMGMTFRERTEYFADEPDDANEAEPDSAAGKDG